MAGCQKTVNIHEAKTHFSRLITQACSGKTIIIARAGIPVAKLVPVEAERAMRKPGFLRGQLSIASDFDAPLPLEIQEAFNGKS